MLNTVTECVDIIVHRDTQNTPAQTGTLRVAQTHLTRIRQKNTESCRLECVLALAVVAIGSALKI